MLKRRFLGNLCCCAVRAKTKPEAERVGKYPIRNRNYPLYARGGIDSD